MSNLEADLLAELKKIQDEKSQLMEVLKNDDIVASSRVNGLNAKENEFTQIFRDKVDYLIQKAEKLQAIAMNDSSPSALDIKAEFDALKAEETQELRLISAVDAETASLNAHIDSQNEELRKLQDQIESFNQSYIAKHRAIDLKLESLNAERQEINKLIAQKSEAEAELLSPTWDETVNSAVKAVEDECEKELAEADEMLVNELNRHSAVSRVRASQTANDLADVTASHYDQLVAPLLLTLNQQITASRQAIHQYSEEEGRLRLLLDSVLSGVDSGEDVLSIAPSFTGAKSDTEWLMECSKQDADSLNVTVKNAIETLQTFASTLVSRWFEYSSSRPRGDQELVGFLRSVITILAADPLATVQSKAVLTTITDAIEKGMRLSRLKECKHNLSSANLMLSTLHSQLESPTTSDLAVQVALVKEISDAEIRVKNAEQTLLHEVESFRRSYGEVPESFE